MNKVTDISPFCFNPIVNPYKRGCYVQKFYYGDLVDANTMADFELRVISDTKVQSLAEVINVSTKDQRTMTWDYYDINDTTREYTCRPATVAATTWGDGIYEIILDGVLSEQFEITSDGSILESTTLIRCSHYDNNSFDNIWWYGDTQKFVSFRIEGGFDPAGIIENVESEYFRDQFQSVIPLYSVPYETYTLTIGSESGVPYWAAKSINRMLSVSYFTVGDKRYVRSENSVPTKTNIADDSQLFVYNQILELYKNDISGIGGQPEQGEGSGRISFKITNARDGEILRYNSSIEAWENTDTID